MPVTTRHPGWLRPPGRRPEKRLWRARQPTSSEDLASARKSAAGCSPRELRVPALRSFMGPRS
eukprot:2945963-Alexandrium_andersonii.AAC.1